MVTSRDSKKFFKNPYMNKIFGLGRRKRAVANVQVKLGSGLWQINNQSEDIYFKKQPLLVSVIKLPLKKIQAENKYDISVKVNGGGLVGQAYAIRLGIARSLSTKFKVVGEASSFGNVEENRLIFRQENYLTRDPRVKERYKYGRKKARKSPQFSKR